MALVVKGETDRKLVSCYFPSVAFQLVAQQHNAVRVVEQMNVIHAQCPSQPSLMETRAELQSVSREAGARLALILH